MRKLIFALLLLSVTATAQQWDADWFFQYSQDLNMAVNGPYKGKPNDIGTTYNAELSVGREFYKGVNGFRFSGRVEIHPAIDYTKATWLEVAYLLKDHLIFFKVKGFNQYIGAEIQTIYRKNPNYDWTDPYNYTKYLNTPIQAGINAELQYMIPGTNFGASANCNVFQPEDIDGKKVRWDVMVGVVYKFKGQ